MDIEQRIKAFSRLGNFLNKVIHKNENTIKDSSLTNADYISFNKLIKNSSLLNGWFTKENVRIAIKAISNNLNEEVLQKWLNKEKLNLNKQTKSIGVIMAGNIPCVGFHDFLCVLISGNRFIGKLSSDDLELLPAIAKILTKIEPDFTDFICFTENKLESFDAVIATGSNNSARYFEYYFSKYPHIVRKNRNSIAILNGEETLEELKGLCQDIFLYFGRGCRNVSKIFIPINYSFEKLIMASRDYDFLINNKKYYNNYIYNKTILSINNIAYLDNTFMILKEDKSLSSPVSVLNYESYDDINKLKLEISEKFDNIQCLVSKYNINNNLTLFGKTQFPYLWDYADNINIFSFLNSV